MKKLLLSSIIMFGVCGFVTAQSATDSKLKRTAVKPGTTATATQTPQKAAVTADSEAKTAEVVVAADADGKQAAAQPARGKQPASKTASATTVDAAGVVVDADIAKKKELEKAEAAKAAAAKKSKDN